MLSLTEATQAIKKAGANNVRVVPMPGQSVNDGDHQIELKNGESWELIVSGMKKSIAEQIVSQALNRVICG